MNQQKIKQILILIIIGLSICLLATTFQTERQRLASGIIMMQKIDITANTGGTIKNICHQKGDTVQQGDILYELDGQELADNIAKAEATVLKIEDDLRALSTPNAAKTNAATVEETIYQEAANKAQQYQSLYDQGAISRNMLIQAQTDRDIAYQALQTARARTNVYDAGNPAVIAMKQEELAYAKQNLQTLQEQKAALIITSPVSGTITDQIYQVGQRVEQGYLLANIAVKENCTLTAYISNQQKTNLTEGQQVEIAISTYPDKTFTGTVETISQPPESTDTRTANGQTRIQIKINNDQNLLRSGMQADIYIE